MATVITTSKSVSTSLNFLKTFISPSLSLDAFSGNDLMFTTLDDHVYRYNHAGWAWAIELR